MAEKPKKQITLADAYNLMTPDDSRELYAQWAATYDKTFIEDNKYVYPAKIAAVLAKHMPADRAFSVIDIGCGTGAVGEEIVKLRPRSVIEGVDISPEMIAVASTKLRSDGTKVYEDLHEADLSSTIYFAANYYDFFVSAGTFTIGHLGAYELIDAVSVCRSGATIVAGVNQQHWEDNDFASAITEAVTNKTITRPQYEEVDIYAEGSTHFGDKARVVIFKKL
ncbi:MAG: class I SAM-dependent methyltransferase [Actinomycetota bacterium]